MAMLSDQEREKAVARLTEHLANIPGNRHGAFLTELPETEGAFFYEIDLDGAPAPAARRLVDCCERRLWDVAPPILARILNVLRQLPEIAAIIERISEVPPTAHPLQAHLLIGNRPFVNRVSTRGLIGRLLNGDAPLIGVINGEPLSGRSATVFLTQHAAKLSGGFMQAVVEVKAHLAGEWTIDQVAEELVAQISGSKPAPGGLSTMPDRRAQQLATWVLSEAAASPFDWWLILDGVGNGKLRDGDKLVEALGDNLSKNTRVRRIRLLCIDCPRELPLALQPVAEQEDLPSPAQQIDDADLKDFFTTVLQSRADPSELHDMVSAAVASVHSRSAADIQKRPAERIPILCASIQKVTRDILR